MQVKKGMDSFSIALKAKCSFVGSLVLDDQAV